MMTTASPAPPWLPLAEHLPVGWSVVAFDMPWSTGSDFRWWRTGIPADCVRRMLADFSVPVRALVGHSFGANAVLGALARPEPPGCKRAALITPFNRPPELPVT